ncbi:MAG TPA: hypothetical protein DCM08_04755 [Microscillaceae bacterium]|nr:hypothetical protein [Microscillaceae bacterium]
MLGSILHCIEELVQKDFSTTQWETILEKSGLDKKNKFFAHKVYEDQLFDSIYENTCTTLKLDSIQLSEAFGDAWMKYASANYFAFFTVLNSAKEFILNMDKVHERITSRVENATPPRFIYETIDAQTMTMEYQSHRNLAHVWVGLLKAVGKHFNETITIEQLEENKVKMTFSK